MIWSRALAEADRQAAAAQERCDELASAMAVAEGRAASAEAAREAADQDLQRQVQRWKLQAEAASRAAKLLDSSSSASVRETTEEANDLRQHVSVAHLHLSPDGESMGTAMKKREIGLCSALISVCVKHSPELQDVIAPKLWADVNVSLGMLSCDCIS